MTPQMARKLHVKKMLDWFADYLSGDMERSAQELKGLYLDAYPSAIKTIPNSVAIGVAIRADGRFQIREKKGIRLYSLRESEGY